MPSIIVKSFKRGALSDEDYSWLLQRLGKPIELMAIYFEHHTGDVSDIVLYKEADSCVTLFIKGNNLVLEMEALTKWKLP